MLRGPRTRYYNQRWWTLEVGGVREATLTKFIEYFQLKADQSLIVPSSDRRRNGIQKVTFTPFVTKAGLVSSTVKVLYVAKGNSPRDIKFHIRRATNHAGGNMPTVTPIGDEMTRLGTYISKQDIERFGLTK